MFKREREKERKRSKERERERKGEKERKNQLRVAKGDIFGGQLFLLDFKFFLLSLMDKVHFLKERKNE